MSVNVDVLFGSLWSHNKISLEYSYGDIPLSELRDRITILSATKRSKGWFGSYGNPTTVTGSQISTNDKAQLLINLVAQGRTLNSHSYKHNNSLSPANALQVRCVKM